MAILQWLSAGLYGALALVAARIWWRDRSRAASWLAGGFAAVGVVALFGALPESWQQAVPTRSVVALLLALPWLLYRFAHSFARTGERHALALLVHGLAGVVVGFALFGPPLAEAGQDQPGWMLGYSIVALAYWGIALADGSWSFFAAARGQADVIQRRLRRLGQGYAALALSLVIQSFAGGDPGHPARWGGTLIGIVAGALFLEGFAPGEAVRRRWRADAEAEVDRTTMSLMTATTSAEVTSSLLPAVAEVTGADVVRLVAPGGATVHQIGVDVDGPRVTEVVELHHGRLEVVVSPWSPLFGSEEQRLLGRLGTIADLALDRVELLERERDARRLAERATRDRDALLAAVAHDMKGPLTAIHGFAELLLGPLADEVSPRARKFIARIADNSNFVATLSRDLVDLGSAGADAGHEQRVVLERLVHDLAEPLAFTHPQATVDVGPLPVVWMDPTRARQVFDNLLSNAVRYSGRPDVRICLRAEVLDDGSIHVDVHDDGVGIREADVERVFELFERLGTNDVGSGLGMAITRRIMEGVGGSIEVVPSDVGACFRLHFPAPAVASLPSALVEPAASHRAAATTLASLDQGVAPWMSGSGS